jgi:hypothetical protein
MRQRRSWAMEPMIEPMSSTPFSPGIRPSDRAFLERNGASPAFNLEGWGKERYFGESVHCADLLKYLDLRRETIP